MKDKKTLTANQNPHDYKELASRAYKMVRTLAS